MAGSRSDGGRDGEGNAGGNPAGRSDLAVAGQYLPEHVGSDLGGAMWPTRGTGSIRRCSGGDVPDGIGEQGSTAADRAGDELARSDTASSEDADGGLEAR